MQNVKVTRKGKIASVPARLFVIFARKSPSAVIFRRGPSKWVQLIQWNTLTDEFQAGHWFHGRLYERRADLSPNGSLLIYFAQKISVRSLKDHEYTYAWTAVSKPPFLTALALWPKGDCWHGGGSFVNNKTILLNHKREASKAHPKHKPKGLKVILKDNVRGEDDPIFSERLERDGWKLEQEWKVENKGFPLLYVTLQPEIREKLNPGGTHTIRLTRSISTLDYSEEFCVTDIKRSILKQLDRASWADWDQQGRLIFAQDGKLYAGLINNAQISEKVLIDLNASKPISFPAPEWAKKF
jgi:hypothetical protein